MHVFMHPNSYEATGLVWDFNGKETYLYDTKLPFGARVSPPVFHHLSLILRQLII